jgi:hypothetical protein
MPPDLFGGEDDEQLVTWVFRIQAADADGEPLDYTALNAELQEVAAGLLTDDSGEPVCDEEGLLRVELRLEGFPGVVEHILQSRGAVIVSHHPGQIPG